MTNPIKLSLLLTSCAALMACDQADDIGDPSGLSLIEITAARPPTLASTPVSSSGLAVQSPSASTPEQSTLGVTNKAKAAKPEHMIGWLRWAIAQPFATGAIADPTGEQCAMGQSGKFWYLAGTFGGPVVRECSVPAGKTLVLPLVNQWWVFPPEYFPNGEGIEESMPDNEAWMDEVRANICGLTLRIDGQDVRASVDELDEDFYIRVVDPFEVVVHDEHWAVEWFDGGPMPSIGDGFYAVVKPLPPGDHVIEFGGEICGEYPFATAATYQLHVGP